MGDFLSSFLLITGWKYLLMRLFIWLIKLDKHIIACFFIAQSYHFRSPESEQKKKIEGGK